TPRTVAPGGTHRHLDTQFRGSLASDKGCAEQRNQVINTLRKLVDTKKYKIQLGSRVPRRTFLQELKQSKVCISPFGWGELCYRDFEGMQMGSLLIKPSVSHAETFPDYFQEHETYVPIRWDISDLTETFEEVIQNYTHYLDIARAAQKKLEFYATNAEAFVDHFVKIIS
ncbi:MAG: glycosyltransferase family 1 protein, partial [Planctomycetota bacterium]